MSCRLGVGLLICASVATTAGRARHQPRQTPSLIQGLDHIVVAVNDLEAASERYRAFGFALKPGRPHDNGIRNQHVKFTDGTEVELLTAPDARDPLTRHYREHLAAGDGPAFLALFASDIQALADRLAPTGAQSGGGFITYPSGHPTGHIFFGGRNHSPTDRPEHFAHGNSADSLVAGWLAAADFSSERRLFAIGGGVTSRRTWRTRGADFDTITIGDGAVYLFPATLQGVKGRKVLGATLRVKDLAAVRRSLELSGVSGELGGPSGPDTIVLPPAATMGLWLEFQQRR
jgi:hypothetical protein